MKRIIIYSLLLSGFFLRAGSQDWSPWMLGSMGDTTHVVVDTIPGQSGDSIVYTWFNYTLGQIIDPYSVDSTFLSGYGQGISVWSPGDIDTFGLAYEDDLKLRLFFTKNIFLGSEWQSEDNPDIYFELHQFTTGGEWERRVYERRFKELEGFVSMIDLHQEDYYMSFSDSIDVILGPDQERNLKLLAFAIGSPDTIINEDLTNVATAAYYSPANFTTSMKKLHSVELSWMDSSAYSESYDVYRDSIFIGNVPSQGTGDISFVDRYIFGSTASMEPGSEYSYAIIARNSLFPGLQDTSAFRNEISLTTLDIGLSSSLEGEDYLLTWDNSAMSGSDYDRLTIVRGNEVVYTSADLEDSYLDSLPVFGQPQDYYLLLSKDEEYLVSFKHKSDSLPANGLVRGYVYTEDRLLPVRSSTVTARTIIDGDTCLVSAQTDRFGYFEIQGIFYGRSANVILEAGIDSARYGVLLSEFQPVSTNKVLLVEGGNIERENSPVVSDVAAFPVDSTNLVELSFECAHTGDVLYQLFRNEKFVTITDQKQYRDSAGMPGEHYRYTVIPFLHLEEYDYLLGDPGHSDVEYPKLTVPAITLQADPDSGFVSISVHHDAPNLDGIMIFRDSLVWKLTEGPWNGSDKLGEPGKLYEYSVQAFRYVGDTFSVSGINRALVEYPDLPVCNNITSHNEGGFLEISWNFSADESGYNFDGYRIYRDSALIGFVLKGRQHSIFDYHGIPGSAHHYSVTSYLQVEDRVFESGHAGGDFTVPLLATPDYISAIEHTDGNFRDQVIISWESDVRDTYDGFILVRDGGSDGSESFEIPSPYQSSYIDMVNLTDLNYKMGFFENLIRRGNAEVEYKLVAYADHDTLRYFSDTARTSYTFTLQDTSGVFAPVDFTASDYTSGNITLDWDYPEFLTSTFLLFRDSEFVGELPVGIRRYQDIDVEPGSRYIYHLRAVYNNDSSIFVADAGSVSSGQLVHGKVIDRNYQPVENVKIDLAVFYSDLDQYRNSTVSNASGYFSFPDLSLHELDEVHIEAVGVNSAFEQEKFEITASAWDGNHIYVEFIDTTDYKLQQQESVATPVACVGSADNGSGLLYLTWGASNANFSFFEIYRGLRLIGRVPKGQALILTDSTATPGHTQVYTAMAVWEKGNGPVYRSSIVPFAAEAPFIAPVENLEVIPFPEKNRVEISWSHPTNNVDGYYVYRNGVRIDTSNKVPFMHIDTTGLPDYRYKYSVSAYWRNGDGIEFESWSREQECVFPEVFDPTRITLSSTTNSVILEWECDAENYDGFLVYRGYAVIDSVPFGQFFYRDYRGGPRDHTMFGVAAFRRIGDKLITSRIREDHIEVPQIVPVNGITRDSTDHSITIGWDYGGEGENLSLAVDGFKVFRDTDPDPILVIPSGVESHYSFTDDQVDPEEGYDYSIIAYRNLRNDTINSSVVIVSISTERLHPPYNFRIIASPSTGCYKLSWEYYGRLDINGFILDRTPGLNENLANSDRSFIDTEGNPLLFRIYAEKNGKLSDYAEVDNPEGILHNAPYSIEASEGTSERVKLVLRGLSDDSYSIERDGELIASPTYLPGQATDVIYDSDVDPGRRYVYSIYNGSGIIMSSVGWAKPDGVISGFVRTIETVGVPQVEIRYTGSYYDADSNFTIKTAATMTDGSGAYVFNNVVYGDNTEYTLEASRPGHHFRENVKSVELTENRFQVSCDFTDTTAIILAGTVRHLDLETGWEGVPVLLNTLNNTGNTRTDTSVTDESGRYSFTIEPDNPGITGYEMYVMPEPERTGKIHAFLSDRVVFDTDTLRKFDAVTLFDFIDTLRSDLTIRVLNGGGEPIPKPFILKIHNTEYGYEEIAVTGTGGEVILNVPPADFQIELLGVENNILDNELYGAYFRGKVSIAELAKNNKVTEAITEFVYHTPATIKLLYTTMEAPQCIGDYVISQNRYYMVDFIVTENHGGEEVPVKSGKIRIRNGAAQEHLAEVSSLQNGEFEYYVFNGGEPEMIQPFRKYLFASFEDDHGQKLGELSIPIVVEGKKSIEGTDIFINPESFGDKSTAHIPLYVLRDPPGDGSSAFLESGVTVNRSLELGEEESYYSGFKTEGSVIVAGVAGRYWETDLKTAESHGASTAYEMSMTSSQRLETSGDALDGQNDKPLVGKEADVIVGMDLLFAYTIQYDLAIEDCEVVRKTVRTTKPTGIKSTWMYTRNQIEAMIGELHDLMGNPYGAVRSGAGTGTATSTGPDPGEDPGPDPPAVETSPSAETPAEEPCGPWNDTECSSYPQAWGTPVLDCEETPGHPDCGIDQETCVVCTHIENLTHPTVVPPRPSEPLPPPPPSEEPVQSGSDERAEKSNTGSSYEQVSQDAMLSHLLAETQKEEEAANDAETELSRTMTLSIPSDGGAPDAPDRDDLRAQESMKPEKLITTEADEPSAKPGGKKSEPLDQDAESLAEFGRLMDDAAPPADPGDSGPPPAEDGPDSPTGDDNQAPQGEPPAPNQPAPPPPPPVPPPPGMHQDELPAEDQSDGQLGSNTMVSPEGVPESADPEKLEEDIESRLDRYALISDLQAMNLDLILGDKVSQARGAGSSEDETEQIDMLKVRIANWQAVLDYLDQSGDPVYWAWDYYKRLGTRIDALETHYNSLSAVKEKGLLDSKAYYGSIADQLHDIIEKGRELHLYLDEGPPRDNSGAFDYASGAVMEWYKETINRINEFEGMNVLDVSQLDQSKIRNKKLKKIYETSIESGDDLYGDMLSYPQPKNYTFGGGITFESSTENTISRSTGFSQVFTSENSAGGGYAMSVESSGEVGWWAAYFETKWFAMEAQVGGYGGWDASTSAESSEGRDSTVVSGFTLSDDDPGDHFSVNVYPSLDPTQTAYFALVGGRSSCPEEKGTIYRDAPTLTVGNPLGEEIATNILENLDPDEEAVFPLKIGSLNPFGEDRDYTLSVDPASNRFNATILANGSPLGEQVYSVSPVEPSFIDLSIQRRSGIFEADSIEIIISSSCEGNISESIFLSAFWERPCTPVAIVDPVDNWVSNRYNDEMLIQVTDFDPDCEVLNSLRLECRKGGQNHWVEIAGADIDSVRSFVHATSLIYKKPTFLFTWYVNDPVVEWEDGDYQLRVIADCNNLGGGQTYSNIVSGTIDRKNIRLAAPPEPLSGILTMGGGVKARFTEEVAGYEYLVLNGEGDTVVGLEMIADGQEIVLLGADNAWRSANHNETFTVELRNVEDYWGNSTQSTRDSLIAWSFRVWNAPIYIIRDQYEVSVPVNGRQLVLADLFSNLIECREQYFGQTAGYTMTSSTPASLSVRGPQSLSLPGHDSLVVHAHGNRDVGEYNESILFDNLLIGGVPYPDMVINVTVRVVPELAPWEIDGGQFESTMNIVTNFEIGVERSEDPLDMIAAYAGNSIRGLAQVEDVGGGSWAAYLTVGELPGEDLDGSTLEFRVWDASEGKEYDAHPDEEVIFISNSAIGTSIEPLILRVDPEVDLASYRELHAGWNYVAFTPASLFGGPEVALRSLTPSEGSVIKTLSDFATYTDEFGWIPAGEEFGLDPLQGYMLYLDGDQRLRYTGSIALTDTALDIRHGWNLVAYPFGKQGTLSQVLELSANSTTDLIKGEDPGGELQFSDYSSSAWTGTLSTLYPMHSYMLKSEGSYAPKLIWNTPMARKSAIVAARINGATESDASNSASQGATAKDAADQPATRSLYSAMSPDQVPDPAAFEKNMTVIGVVHLDDIESVSDRDSIIVMQGDSVVGQCALHFKEQFNRYFASFMVYGNADGEEYNVYMYNYDRDSRYPVDNMLEFSGDESLGDWYAPYRFKASTVTGYSDARATVEGLRAWTDQEERSVKVEFFTNQNCEHQFGIYDLSGREVITVEYHSHAGMNYLEIPMKEDEFSSGVYFLRSLKDMSQVVKLFLY